MDSPPTSQTELDSIRALAFGAGDGAYAWKKEALPVVLKTLAAGSLAVVGGEIWGIIGYEIYPAVPTRMGHTRIYAWSAPDKAPDTDWPTYVNECVRHARRAIQDLDAESQVAAPFRHRLVYHLHFFNEKDYPVDMRRAIP